MKKIFLILLTSCLLPIFSAAQEPPTPSWAEHEPPVQIPYSCGAGKAFTIRVPVKFAEGRSVQYVWYRNDVAITTAATLPTGAKSIAYTIPGGEAFGDSVTFYFKYSLNDGSAGWTFSHRYLVSFLASGSEPQASSITGNAIVCTGVSGYVYTVTHMADVYFSWAVSAGWRITAGQGTNRITVTAGTTNGTVSVTPANHSGVGDTRTHAVAIAVPIVPGAASLGSYSCNDRVANPGVASISTYSCDSENPGAASFGSYPCSDLVVDPGVASIAPYQNN